MEKFFICPKCNNERDIDSLIAESPYTNNIICGDCYKKVVFCPNCGMWHTEKDINCKYCKTSL